jgi:hypothetical protein
MSLKDESDFFVRDKLTGRLHAQCKQCYSVNRTTYAAQHYKTYGDLYRERARKRRTRIKKELQVNLLDYLTGNHVQSATKMTQES